MSAAEIAGLVVAGVLVAVFAAAFLVYCISWLVLMVRRNQGKLRRIESTKREAQRQIDDIARTTQTAIMTEALRRIRPQPWTRGD